MKQYLVLAPAMLLGVGVLLISGIREQYAVSPAQPLESVPRSFIGRESKSMVLSEDEKRVSGVTDYIMRAYGNDSTSFSVYVGFYSRQIQGQSIHSPKNCLPGAGWEIVQSSAVPLKGAGGVSSVNRVLLAQGRARAMVYYWYQGRGRVEPSEYVVKWNLLHDAALYGRTEEALVRVIVPVSEATNMTQLNANVAKADTTALLVATELLGHVQRVMPGLQR